MSRLKTCATCPHALLNYSNIKFPKFYKFYNIKLFLIKNYLFSYLYIGHLNFYLYNQYNSDYSFRIILIFFIEQLFTCPQYQIHSHYGFICLQLSIIFSLKKIIYKFSIINNLIFYHSFNFFIFKEKINLFIYMDLCIFNNY